MEAGKKQEEKNELVQSFLFVRQALGIIGFALPISLLLFSLFTPTNIQPSISEYYHTPMGDVLVGALCAIGVFLLTYKGYQKKSDEWLSDKWVARVAGCAAIGVALFPMRQIASGETTNCIAPASGFTCHPSFFHFGSAAIFFACLALFCLFIFTRGDRTDQGKIIWTQRNKMFVACGALILLSIIALMPYMFFDIKETLDTYKYMFFWESVGVLAFATSWLTKGRALSEFKNMIGRLGNRVSR